MKKLYFPLFLLSILIGSFYGGFYQKHIFHKIYRSFHKPTISVVMSTYNRDYGLPTAIRSILNQSYTDFELILIDDGSEDRTAGVIKYFMQKDPRIVFLKNDKNKGLIYSLNKGLKAAQGKYIARMDDDDESLPERFERQIQVMEKHPEFAVLGTNIGSKEGKYKIDLDSVPKLKDSNELEINTYFSSGLAHPTIMMRRDFLTQNNIWYPDDYLYAEDCGIYKLILNKGGKLSTIEEPLLRFRVTRSKPTPGGGYGSTQSDSFKKLQQDKLRPLIGEVEPHMLGAFAGMDNRCILMKRMAKSNKDKNVLDQETLEKKIINECPDDSGKRWSTKHPYWEDILVRENNKRIRRTHASDSGSIIKETKNTLIIKWDDYPAEIYKKDEKRKKFIYQKDGDGTIKTPPK